MFTRHGLAVAVLLAACGDDATTIDAEAPGDARDGGTADAADAGTFVAADPVLISTASPANDEDPFVLRASDGWYYVIWFSARTGAGDIYLRRTRDGVSWSAAIQVSSGPDTDLYPSLYEDADQVLRAAWFRRVGSPDGRGHIVTTSTTDPLVWSPSMEVAVTAPVGAENDWTPTISRPVGGALTIAFARDACYPSPQPCFSVLVTQAVGEGWSAPTPLADATGAQDHLPFVLASGGGLLAAWNRYDAAATLPYLTSTTDVLIATSTDGATWTSPLALTDDDAQQVADVFPVLFRDHDGQDRVMWLAAGPASTAVVDRPVTGGPGGGTPIAALPSQGYSHHVVATATPGVYLGAWVEGPDGARDIYARVLTR